MGEAVVGRQSLVAGRSMSSFTNISKPWGSEKKYQCPCCLFKTLHSRGMFELCPVCFWEDDGQDDHDVDQVRGGPNGSLSLADARSNFRLFRASDDCFRDKVRTALADELIES